MPAESTLQSALKCSKHTMDHEVISIYSYRLIEGSPRVMEMLAIFMYILYIQDDMEPTNESSTCPNDLQKASPFPSDPSKESGKGPCFS